MTLVGALIKKGIEIGAPWREKEAPAKEMQREQLRFLLKSAKDTAFGKYYHFSELMEAEDPVKAYQQRLPIFDYDKMYERWWRQSLSHPDICWPGKPKYIAKSSGTTGSEPKRIPVTDAMLDSIRQVSFSQFGSIRFHDMPEDFFTRELLALSSATELEKVKGRVEGEISAITTLNAPDWFDNFYRPGHEIASIQDWDKRLEAIAKAAPDWDIGVISGIPSWLLLMLKKIIEVHKLDHIHEIWPGLGVFTPGGVAFEPYREKFDEIFGKEVIIKDTYLASEGFLAYNRRPGTMSMRLALHHGLFFEFIPFDEEGFDETGNLKENPKVLSIGEVEEEREYALLVSTPAGTYRYMIGDTIRFTNLAESEIKITGRTKHFLNVVGSQLTEAKMDQAIDHLNEEHHLAVEEFTLAAVEQEDGDFYHEWILGRENGQSVDDSQVAEQIDQYLKENHKNYEVARRKALKGVKVHQTAAETFYDFQSKQRKAGGQIKTRKLRSAEDFQEFLKFATQRESED